MFGTLFLLLLKSGTSITIPPPPLLLQGCYFFVMSNVACLKCNNTAMKGEEKGEKEGIWKVNMAIQSHQEIVLLCQRLWV